jgi:hypothetical protein
MRKLHSFGYCVALLFALSVLVGCGSDQPSEKDMGKTLINAVNERAKAKASLDHIEVMKPLPDGIKDGVIGVGFRLKTEEDLFSEVGSFDVEEASVRVYELAEPKGLLLEGRAELVAEQFDGKWRFEVDDIQLKNDVPHSYISVVNNQVKDLDEINFERSHTYGFVVNKKNVKELLDLLEKKGREIKNEIVVLKDEAKSAKDEVNEYYKTSKEGNIKVRELERQYNKDRGSAYNAFNIQLNKEYNIERKECYDKANAFSDELQVESNERSHANDKKYNDLLNGYDEERKKVKNLYSDKKISREVFEVQFNDVKTKIEQARNDKQKGANDIYDWRSAEKKKYYEMQRACDTDIRQKYEDQKFADTPELVELQKQIDEIVAEVNKATEEYNAKVNKAGLAAGKVQRREAMLMSIARVGVKLEQMFE